MKFVEGSQYELVHMGEGNRLVRYYVSEIYPYEGAYVFYGYTMSHQIHVPLTGVGTALDRPSVPVIFPHETGPDLLKFTDAIGGAPLAIKEIGQDDILIVVNMGSTIKMFWDGDLYNKDGMIAMGRDLVLLYRDWMKLGKKLPAWYRTLRAVQSE